MFQKGVTVTTDPFGGVHVVFPKTARESAADAITELHEELMERRPKVRSLWLSFELPIDVHDIAAMVPRGFCNAGISPNKQTIYDYQRGYIHFWTWLHRDDDVLCAIPDGATFDVGAQLIIVDSENSKVLVMRDVQRSHKWDGPGGRVDFIADDGDPRVAALREAREEVGFEPAYGDPYPVFTLVDAMVFRGNQFAPAVKLVYRLDEPGASKRFTPCLQDTEVRDAYWADIDDVLEGRPGKDDLPFHSRFKLWLR